MHGKNEIKCILLNTIIAKYTDEIRNSTFNFRTSFQWNRNGESGTQLPKLLSFHLRTSLWFYQTSHSGTFCFTPGWMKKRVPDHLRFVIWNEMIKLRRQFVQNDDTRKKIVSKLTTAIKLYVNVNWETTFLPLWREELNKRFSFFFWERQCLQYYQCLKTCIIWYDFNKDIPVLQFC